MKKGFMLIELAIVLSIIGILAAVAGAGLAKLFQKSVVTVDGKEVFRGPAICVEVQSAGAATKVDVGIPCKFPGRHWTSSAVHVETL